MRSLKIIIFRDTDKPYTMILSPKVLIGTSFAIVALFSLLTFSVMSNVMFVTFANSNPVENNSEVQGIFANNNNDQPIENPNNAEGNEPKDNASKDPSEEVPENNEAVDPAIKEQPQEEIAQPQEDLTTEAVEEKPAVEDPPVETNMTTLEPFNLQSGDLEVGLISSPAISSNSIRVKAQVRKRLNRGVSSRGRFVAALLDNSGNFSKTFPLHINADGREIMNPQRGDSFRIRYSRDYDVRFDNIDPADYSSIVLMIFDQDSYELIWRNVVPVSK